MTWNNGNQRTSTKQWKRIRTQARNQLDYQCQAADNHNCHGPLQLDHKTPHHQGGTDTLDNLQWLCTHHHNQKTQHEAHQARMRKQARRHLPTKPHPGLV